MARDLHRVNLNVPTELLSRIDEYAKKMGLTRSSAFCQLSAIALETNDAIQVTKRFMDMVEDMGGADAIKAMSTMQHSENK